MAIPRRYKALFFWILAAVFSLEMTARLRYFGLEGLSYAKLDSFHAIGESGLLRVSPDPDISFELKPRLDTYFKLKKFSTNSAGFRDKEYSLQKPSRTFRIAVLGASYVMGAGVPLEKTFHSILEERLNQEFRDFTFEVINMGVGGHTQWETLAMLKKKALMFNPDLILFGTSPYMYKFDRQPPVKKIRSVRHPFFNLFFLEPVKIKLNALFKRDRPKVKPAPADEVVRRNIDQVFGELGDIQEATKIPVCVVVLEHRDYRLLTIPEMERLASAHKLLILDTTRFFKNRDKDSYCSNVFDCHPNAAAHEIFADSVYSFLKGNFLLGR
jgi:hypothetical protein